MEIRRRACSRPALLDRRLPIQSGTNASLVVIDGESIQLAMKVETIPEEWSGEILTPKSSDEALYERVRARREGDGLKFHDVEHSQIRAPAMKSEQRVMIGAEAFGKWLTAPGLVEHATDRDAVDMRRFDTESDDTT